MGRFSDQLSIYQEHMQVNGLRMTKQREMVVETFLKTEGHLSTDDLYRLVQKQDRGVGYATVSRTLKVLTECGLARETDLADGYTRFEHYFKHPHHRHLVCSKCRKTIEFLCPELEDMQREIVDKYGFKLIRSTCTIFGICPECQKNQKPDHKTFQPDLIFARDVFRITLHAEELLLSLYRQAAELDEQGRVGELFRELIGKKEKICSCIGKQMRELLRKQPGIEAAPPFLCFNDEDNFQIFGEGDGIADLSFVGLSDPEKLEYARDREQEICDFLRDYDQRFMNLRKNEGILSCAKEQNHHLELVDKAMQEEASLNHRFPG